MWELDHKEGCVLKNWCFWTVVLEKTLESPLDFEEIKPVNPRGKQPWIFIGELMLKQKLQSFGHFMWRSNHWKRPWCRQRWKAAGEGEDRGWDGCMASPTQWTWTWANSRRWWRTGKPSMLHSMGSQKSRMWLSDWTTAKIMEIRDEMQHPES